MKYAVEMDSGAMIYIPSFIEIGSGIKKIDGGGGGGYTDTQTERRSYKPTLGKYAKNKMFSEDIQQSCRQCNRNSERFF
jgi:hypothetical protein